MAQFLLVAFGSGVAVGVIRAVAQHYTTKHLSRKDG